MKKFEVILRKNGEVIYNKILKASDMCVVIDFVTYNEDIISFDEIKVREVVEDDL